MNHYDPFDTRVIEHFLDIVFPIMKEKGCWLWPRNITSRGYGLFYTSQKGKRLNGVWGKPVRAHRYMHELAMGLIPENLSLDHLCRNKSCIRPSHLEAVSQGENVMRGNAPSAHHAAKTYCPMGHPYNSVNTRMNHGSRVCRICHRDREHRRYHSKQKGLAVHD
jgi:hypothetical protein